jgi:hypothetical protein
LEIQHPNVQNSVPHVWGSKFGLKLDGVNVWKFPFPPNPQVVNISKDGNGINSPRKTVDRPRDSTPGTQWPQVFFGTPAEKKRIEELQYHYISLYITIYHYISLF